MGKKSKRRGGGGEGGGKRNARVLNSRTRTAGDQQAGSGGTLATADTDAALSAEEAAALLRVPTPASFKKITSTNSEPTKCVFCLSDLVRLNVAKCCGKAYCHDCRNSSEHPAFFLDLMGIQRCAFCNILASKRTTMLEQEARLGKPWAQYTYGLTKGALGVATEESLHWYRKAANTGNPYAFNELAKIFLGGHGINRDLELSRSFTEKARSLYPKMGLWCNRRLLDIAKAHIRDGEENVANDILLSITRESDENALDYYLCTRVAARINEKKLFCCNVCKRILPWPC